jgi:hypothetical protein
VLSTTERALNGFNGFNGFNGARGSGVVIAMPASGLTRLAHSQADGVMLRY